MKKNLSKIRWSSKGFQSVAIAAILLITVCTLACRKNQEPDKSAEKNNIKSEVTTLGKLHNSGLNYVAAKLLGNKDTVSTSLSKLKGKISSLEPMIPAPIDGNLASLTSAAIVQSSSEYVSSSTEYYGITIDQPTEAISKLNVLDINFNDLEMQNQWATSINDVRVGNVLSTRESNLVSQIQQIFITAYTQNLNPPALKISLHDQLQALKDQNINTNWNANEGELFNGLIEIALSSTDYWCTLVSQAQSGNPGIDPNFLMYQRTKTSNAVKGKVMTGELEPPTEAPVSTPSLIAVDCIGYISGWVSAVWSDYNSQGGLKESGQKHRIGQGVIWALSASVLGMKRFQNIGAFIEPETDPAPVIEP